jgi:hypothetical protein
MRKVHIDDVEWGYTVSTNYLIVKSPFSATESSKRYVIPLTLVLDMDWNQLERAQWKGSPYIAVTPSRVKNYILENIINNTKVPK